MHEIKVYHIQAVFNEIRKKIRLVAKSRSMNECMSSCVLLVLKFRVTLCINNQLRSVINGLVNLDLFPMTSKHLVTFLNRSLKMVRYSLDPENPTKCKLAAGFHHMMLFFKLLSKYQNFSQQHASRGAPTFVFISR